MDLNRDGVVTLDEFLDCCVRDEDISRSMGVFDSSFWHPADGAGTSVARRRDAPWQRPLSAPFLLGA